MIRIAEKNVYGDDMRPETSIVPELLETGVHLKTRLSKAGFEVAPFSRLGSALPDAAVFWDCPRLDDPDLRRCLDCGVPFLLVISENIHLQPHPGYRQLKKLATKVLTYDLDEVDHKKAFWLPYAMDLENGRKHRKSIALEGRPFLLGMINSWKKSEMPGDLYGMRNRLAIEAGIILKDRMFLAGSGWDGHLVYESKGQRSLAKRFPRLARILWGWPNQAYRGRLPLGDRKLTVLSQCDFALCPENCTSLNGYITEKIFNAVFAGCIPIYQGHPDVTRWLPPEMFVPMERFSNGRELTNFLQKMGPREKKEYRDAGARFLQSRSAELFDLRSYEGVFLQHLKSALSQSKPRRGAAFARDLGK